MFRFFCPLPVPSPQNDLPQGARGGGGVGAYGRSKADPERKIGHRRVGEGGEITYKKIQTTQIMGAIQLGIQHTVSKYLWRESCNHCRRRRRLLGFDLLSFLCFTFLMLLLFYNLHRLAVWRPNRSETC